MTLDSLTNLQIYVLCPCFIDWPKFMKRVSENLAIFFRTARNKEGRSKRVFPKKRSRAELSESQRYAFDLMVQDRFGRSIKRHPINHDENLEDLAVTLGTLPQDSEIKSIAELRDGSCNHLIVILPGIYGSCWSFLRLAQLLPGQPRVIGLEYPGIDRTQSIPRTFEKITLPLHTYLQEAMASNQPPRRITFFGFCYGGWLAHALAAKWSAHCVNGTRAIGFDSHPSSDLKQIGIMRRLSHGAKRELNLSRTSHKIERRFVRMGHRQLTAMTSFKPKAKAKDFILARSGSELTIGPLPINRWNSLVENYGAIVYSHLGHLDLIRNQQEHLIKNLFDPELDPKECSSFISN